MNKEMIISSNGHETRVAILEDDLLAEIFVERERNRGVVGNVYKGRVSKVLPGMQSSFVDIGLERDGFLYVSDVVNTRSSSAELRRRRGRAGAASGGSLAAGRRGRAEAPGRAERRRAATGGRERRDARRRSAARSRRSRTC